VKTAPTSDQPSSQTYFALKARPFPCPAEVFASLMPISGFQIFVQLPLCLSGMTTEALTVRLQAFFSHLACYAPLKFLRMISLHTRVGGIQADQLL